MNHQGMKNTFDPIIVTGMHRSGTTLVTRLLEGCNVYFGLYKDVNNEATFFLKRNEAIILTIPGDGRIPAIQSCCRCGSNYFRMLKFLILFETVLMLPAALLLVRKKELVD